MYDRALQALVKLALEPEWEARFEPNSYGFVRLVGAAERVQTLECATPPLKAMCLKGGQKGRAKARNRDNSTFVRVSLI